MLLTLRENAKDEASFDLLEETLSRTNLGDLQREVWLIWSVLYPQMVVWEDTSLPDISTPKASCKFLRSGVRIYTCKFEVDSNRRSLSGG